MKNFLCKYGHVISSFAFMVTVLSAQKNCGFMLHQPEMPDSARRFRKF